VRIAIDASLALSAGGQIEPARSAVKLGLKALSGPGADGLRLDLLLALQQARADPRVTQALKQIVRRIMEGLSPAHAGTFRLRSEIAAIL